MRDEKQKAVAPEREGSDNNRPLDSQWARNVLSSVSAILKKHAEILAFYEAKKSHDALQHRGRCKIYKIAQTQNNDKRK